jgi:hypothetical protein
MELSNTLLKECEALIAQGETEEVLTKLFTVKDQTGYKSEILTLSNRWQEFVRNRMSGMLSNQEQALLGSKINNDLLLLLKAMRREQDGEKVVSDLLQEKAVEGQRWRPVTQTYMPILLAALAAWGISYFAYRNTDCHYNGNLAGTWKVFEISDSSHAELGEINIYQEDCDPFFQLSGAIAGTQESGMEVDFSSKIGGVNDGEIYFVYENFDGEMGVCRGIVPDNDTTILNIQCTDLVGFDRNGQSNLNLKLQWVSANKE